MNDELTFEERVDGLIAAALKDDAFRLPLPPGMARRVSVRLHAAAVPRRSTPRWLKAAAAIAAIASFAAFAASVAGYLGGSDAAGTSGAPEPAGKAIQPEETFEEIFSEELEEIRQQEKQAMNGKTVRSLAAGALAAAAFVVPSAQGAVRSSVFDDVKVWYKGSAGNAVGTADASSNSGGASKIVNLPDLSSGNTHGGTYTYWAWRINYGNQKVDCPYAGVTLDSTPCMVVPKYLNGSSGTATVTIDGVEQEQPWVSRRFCNLYFTSWMSDWASGTVCSNWTCVLRFRSDQVNQASGNANKIIDIGSLYDGTAGKATGVNLLLNTPVALADYACPRTFVSTTQKNYTDIKIKSGRWVDCALVVNGQTLTMWFCWNNGTDEAPVNRLAKISETYPTTAGLPTISANCRVNLASTKDGAFNSIITNGVYSSKLANMGFEGAFHKIAFWDRTLSDDEIREAMAGDAGRPNLVQVGIEGNDINEFAASGNVASVPSSGAGEYLNPTLTSGNPTATISFSCPALWAGMPQYLRLPIASTSSSGSVSIALNGETIGSVDVAANKTAFLFIEKGKILSGDNTLVLTRESGSSIVLDAVTLGGSWRFGENIGSFSYQNEAADNPDNYLFAPSCGADEIHHRGLKSGGGAETRFDFFVPENLVGKFWGVFATRPQNTSGEEKSFAFYANGVKIQDCKLKGGVTTEVKIPHDALTAGWNRLSWVSQSGGDWANIDWHKFIVRKPPKGIAIVIK